MTEPSSRAPGHLDLATLTSGLHVLGVAPAWSAVERALGRLESGRANGSGTEDPTVQADLQTVHDFHQLLERSAETLALALLCGAVLGRASSAESFGEKLLAGLRAISRSYGFDRLDEGERLAHLEALRQTFEDEGLVPKSVNKIPNQIKALDLAGWTDWCRKLRREVEEEPAADRLGTELPKYRMLAWSRWENELAPTRDLLRTTWPKVVPVLADLVCSAAGVSPANRLDLDLGRMGLVAWSELIYWALAQERLDHPQFVPVWVLAPALLRLGFRPGFPSGTVVDSPESVSSNRKLLKISTDPRLREWLGAWELFSGGFPRDDRPCLLVVRADESLTSSWKVAKRGGVLALTRHQLEHITKAAGPSESLKWVEPVLVIVESFSKGLPRDFFALANRAEKVFSLRVSGPVLLTRDSSVSVWEGIPVIQGARSADDLIERAIPFLPRAAS